VVAATLVLFGAGIWPYNAWVSQGFERARLRQALAGADRSDEAGAYFSRELYQAHFYAGRPLTVLVTR
jgi:hypothetical protein